MQKNVLVTKKNFIIAVCLSVLLALILTSGSFALAQSGDYETRRANAIELYKQNKYTEAMPILEKLAVENPQDREVIALAGFMVFANSVGIKDAEAKKKERIRARNYLLRAKELGYQDVLLDKMLAAINPDGSGSESFSKKQEAEDAMRDGEAAFVRGDFKKALEAYARALQADPNLYEAALFTGDVYYKSNEQAKAGEWFAKAIAIDPNRETAYRYWGDSLMVQGKMDEARDKFIEAYINEPYNRLATAGFVKWGNKNNIRLAHPRINIPTDVSSSDNVDTKITLDMSMLDDKKNDGSSSWMMYGLTRASWHSGKDGKLSESFSKAYPNEKKYRHSLAEEMDALKGVLTMLDEDLKKKKIKNLEPSLAVLKKLNDAGLLEAYILLARPDEGIAQDHAAYLKTNRDKLRRYVVEIVLTGGGQ